MPPIPNDAIMQATIEGRHEGQQILSVFTYNLVTEATLPDGNAALDAFFERWQGAGRMLDKWLACVSVNVTQVRTKLQWITPSRYAFKTKVGLNADAGAVSGTAYPVNTSIALTKRTDLAGRDNVGTLHMPGVPSSFITNGALTALGLGKYEDLGNQMLQNISTAIPEAIYVPTLFHRSNPAVTIPITSFETSRYARIMRRRTVGLGS